MKKKFKLFFVLVIISKVFAGCGYSPHDEVIEGGMDLTEPTIAEVTAIVSPVCIPVFIPTEEVILRVLPVPAKTAVFK